MNVCHNIFLLVNYAVTQFSKSDKQLCMDSLKRCSIGGSVMVKVVFRFILYTS